uniref:LysM domain-containing protein n=1 Tax=Caenorhabditis tropicalis TaxID=1561998 RepID=A0A1I7UXZ3_9PELO
MAMKEGSSVEQFAMRSRAVRTSSSEGFQNDMPTYKDVVLIERKIKNGDTLNKLAIKYQVNVAEIKRVNNMVSEQDFLALSKVKIPVSRMRMALGVQSVSSQDEEEEVLIDFDDRTALLREDRGSRDPSVEDIFHKTDTNIAQVREALPEDGNGVTGFHFVTARAPTSPSVSVWMVVLGVLLIFCVLPLLLTFYEEQEEASHVHKTTHAA